MICPMLKSRCIVTCCVTVVFLSLSHVTTAYPQTPNKMAKADVKRLRAHVEVLAGRIGTRSFQEPEKLAATYDYICRQFSKAGHKPTYEEYESGGSDFAIAGVKYKNVIVELKGTAKPEEIIIFGAHYDTVVGSPGADDNASAVAGLLELARLCKDKQLKRTLRFVAFCTEEPPFFRSRFMGSRVHAEGCKKRKEKIIAMFSLEMLGCRNEAKGSQSYPAPGMSFFYPDQGDFIAVVGNISSRGLLNRTAQAMRQNKEPFGAEPLRGEGLKVETLAAPGWLTGVDFSDHYSFWQEGFTAAMITDTAFYRYPHYHTAEDTPEKLDYDFMADVVNGVLHAIEELCGD